MTYACFWLRPCLAKIILCLIYFHPNGYGETLVSLLWHSETGKWDVHPSQSGATGVDFVCWLNLNPNSLLRSRGVGNQTATSQTSPSWVVEPQLVHCSISSPKHLSLPISTFWLLSSVPSCYQTWQWKMDHSVRWCSNLETYLQWRKSTAMFHETRGKFHKII